MHVPVEQHLREPLLLAQALGQALGQIPAYLEIAEPVEVILQVLDGALLRCARRLTED